MSTSLLEAAGLQQDTLGEEGLPCVGPHGAPQITACPIPETQTQKKDSIIPTPGGC